MPSQAVFLNSTANPPAFAAAFIRSMSKPTMFLLSSTISIGGQVASVAITILAASFFAQDTTPKSSAASTSRVRIFLSIKALLVVFLFVILRIKGVVKCREQKSLLPRRVPRPARALDAPCDLPYIVTHDAG